MVKIGVSILFITSRIEASSISPTWLLLPNWKPEELKISRWNIAGFLLNQFF